MVAQTNDTDLHLWVRKRFIDLHTGRMIKKARRAGGGMVDLTMEEHRGIMIEVTSEKELHLRASRGFKYTGTTVALDGSEDNSMCREAADVWNELNVRQRINSAVAEAEAKHKDGTLRWTYGTVQSLITPFPRRGHLDVLQVIN